MKSTHDLLVDSLADACRSERHIAMAWPIIAEGTCGKKLRTALDKCFLSSPVHLVQLSGIFSMLGSQPREGRCEAIDALLRESESLVLTCGRSPAADAAILGVAHKIKNHQIACYSSLKAFALIIKHREAAAVFDHLLDEEYSAYNTLNKQMEELIDAQSPPRTKTCRKEFPSQTQLAQAQSCSTAPICFSDDTETYSIPHLLFQLHFQPHRARVVVEDSDYPPIYSHRHS